MASFGPDKRSKVRRSPERGFYDKATVFSILDASFLAHVGVITESDGFPQPIVIPMLYGRENETIYLHGSSASRLMKVFLYSDFIQLFGDEPQVCLTITELNGIVFAKSTFHSSANYRSVVLYGIAEAITDRAESLHGMEVISEQICKGRWAETRTPTEPELLATAVAKFTIYSASAKIRGHGVVDEPDDITNPALASVWAGVLPIHRHFGEPQTSPDCGAEINPSVKKLIARGAN